MNKAELFCIGPADDEAKMPGRSLRLTPPARARYLSATLRHTLARTDAARAIAFVQAFGHADIQRPKSTLHHRPAHAKAYDDFIRAPRAGRVVRRH